MSRAQATTGATEAIEIGRARLAEIPIAYGAYNFAFMGGSMGSVVGERITRLFERATSERLPVVLLQRFRRRAHARRNFEPDANGQDHERARPLPQR